MVELPSGTVTLLFTDVEGSTHLLTKLGEHYEQVLTDHRRLLRAAFEQAGGQEIDTQGDAFFVAFHRGKAALVAAVEAQRALVSHAWPEGADVRVRMGITTGEPSVGEEGFVGLPVHRGSRICAAAHGGQVLLSGTTRDLVEDELPQGVSLRDLGEHRLKDLERLEHVFQLVIDGLPSDFPPLRTLDPQSARRTPFEGQESELEAATHAAVAVRPWRTLRVRRPGGSGQSGRKASRQILREALLTSARRPLALVVLAGLVLAAVFIEPWIAAAAVAFCGWHVWSSARGLRFLHGFEWMGMRAQAMMGLTSDDAARDQLRRLGAALIDISRIVAAADDELDAVRSTTLTVQLHNYREALALSPFELREADALAAKITAIGELEERRRALDEACNELEERVTGLRDRMFDARHNPASSAGIAEEIEALLMTVEPLRMNLGAALDRARQLQVPGPMRRRVAPRRRRNPRLAVTEDAPTPPLGSADRSGSSAGQTHPDSKERMKMGHWRCFWRWPLGHRWTRRVEGNHSWMQCNECGRKKGATFRPGVPPSAGFHGGG